MHGAAIPWLVNARKVNACTPTSVQQRTDGDARRPNKSKENMAPMQICSKLRLFIELTAGSGGKIPSYLCQVTTCSRSLPHTHSCTHTHAQRGDRLKNTFIKNVLAVAAHVCDYECTYLP